MSKNHPRGCTDEAWRVSNDELQALVMDAARHDLDSAQKLFRVITPLLTAIYDGQVQAGRLDPGEVAHLVQQALLAVSSNRGRRDPGLPFRAHLLDIARSTMRAHRRRHGGETSPASVGMRGRTNVSFSCEPACPSRDLQVA